MTGSLLDQLSQVPTCCQAIRKYLVAIDKLSFELLIVAPTVSAEEQLSQGLKY